MQRLLLIMIKMQLLILANKHPMPPLLFKEGLGVVGLPTLQGERSGINKYIK
jgi:hypothetical protein